MSEFWTVPKILAGRVYIIGGGPSLDGVNLLGLNEKGWVLGINDACFKYSCDFVFFGDVAWYHYWYNRGLLDFEGMIITCQHPDQCVSAEKWIFDKRVHVIERQWKGLSVLPNKLAWNYSSGAAAVNLAILMGADEIVLLGYDMKYREENGEVRTNWHNNNITAPVPEIFPRFISGFQTLRQEMKLVDMDCRVLNAGPDSDLNVFPKVELRSVA